MMSCHLTLEQMEVIRRIKNSGATLEQITEAYRILDKVDKELGSFGLACNVHKHELQLDNSSCESSSRSLQISDIHTSQPTDNDLDDTTHGINTTQPQSLQHGNEANAKEWDSASSTSHVRDTDVKCIEGDKFISERLPDGVLKEACKCFLSSLSKECFVDLIKKCASTSASFDPFILCKNRGLIADEVLLFLNGEISKVDKEKQRCILDWFSGILCQADWFVQDMTLYSKDFIEKETSQEAEDFNFIPKRERFIFRDIHIDVLESNFRRNQYPTYHEKTLIANECNMKMAMRNGCELQQKDRVTFFNVDGWFRNKRKYLIRQSKCGGRNPNPVEASPKEDDRIKMTPSDICNTQISNESIKMTPSDICNTQISNDCIKMTPSDICNTQISNDRIKMTPSDICNTQISNDRIKMTPSDIYNTQMSYLPIPSGHIHLSHNSPQHQISTLPMPVTIPFTFRPSISIPSIPSYVSSSQQSTIQNHFNSEFNNVPTSTRDETIIKNIAVKEEIDSEEFTGSGPTTNKLPKLNVSSSLWS